MPCPADYNQYLDAADFIRVLLATYAKYPALEDNPVVVVGESYGGTRAQILLQALRNPAHLDRSDGMFADASLAQGLSDHAKRVADRRHESALSPRNAEDQFSWQILIQPSVVSEWFILYRNLYTPGVTLGVEERAQALGVDLTTNTCADGSQRDSYRLDQCHSMFLQQTRRTVTSLLTPAVFARLMGVAPSDVRGMPAAERQDATRIANIGDIFACTPTDEWFDTLGRLGGSDQYFVAALQIEWEKLLGNYRDGRLFLQNLRDVNTFVTRSLLDTVVVADLLPFALGSYVPGTDYRNPLATDDGLAAIASVTTSIGEGTSAARPGHIDVAYRNAAGGSAPPIRRIRFPTYENAGHMTAQDCPQELFEDVREFLCAPNTP
jgi:pimeloyl-ACP methyl ester carboxylesterase